MMYNNTVFNHKRIKICEMNGEGGRECVCPRTRSGYLGLHEINTECQNIRIDHFRALSIATCYFDRRMHQRWLPTIRGE